MHLKIDVFCSMDDFADQGNLWKMDEQDMQKDEPEIVEVSGSDISGGAWIFLYAPTCRARMNRWNNAVSFSLSNRFFYKYLYDTTA